MHLILIGLGGFFGAISRHLVDGWISSLTRTAFPFGPLTVNVTASLLSGLLFALMVGLGLAALMASMTLGRWL